MCLLWLNLLGYIYKINLYNSDNLISKIVYRKLPQLHYSQLLTLVLLTTQIDVIVNAVQLTSNFRTIATKIIGITCNDYQFQNMLVL